MTSKYNSILAGEASAKFSILLGDVASFDCRTIQLPNAGLIIDYFRWRGADATRNALNSHCYWALRKEGQSPQAATKAMHKLSVSEKNELLFQHDINFNDLPAWQKRGSGLYWEPYEKEGQNPITGEIVTAERRRIKTDFALPMKEQYSEFIAALLETFG